MNAVRWDSTYLSAIVDHLRAQGWKSTSRASIREEHVARLSSLGHTHLNRLGRYAITPSGPTRAAAVALTRRRPGRGSRPAGPDGATRGGGFRPVRWWLRSAEWSGLTGSPGQLRVERRDARGQPGLHLAAEVVRDDLVGVGGDAVDGDSGEVGGSALGSVSPRGMSVAMRPTWSPVTTIQRYLTAPEP